MVFLTKVFLLAIQCLMIARVYSAEVQDNTYILKSNDVIRLTVYEEPDLSVQVRILKTGQASFPLVGVVEISGLSISAATEKIRNLYAVDYLVDPKVTLTVDEYATEFISVIGAVRNPGQIPMPVSGNLDLATTMATAGGLAPDADPEAILLVRASGTTSTFTMSSIEGGSGKVVVRSGDRVIVNQSQFVGKSITVLGQVGKPGPLPFPVSGKLDLVNAIALAGGLTDLANPKKVTINRKGKVQIVDFKSISQRGDRPLLLQPEDVVTVAERLF